METIAQKFLRDVDEQLAVLQDARKALTALLKRSHNMSADPAVMPLPKKQKKHRKMSAAGRRRISMAQKARWAKIRKAA